MYHITVLTLTCLVRAGVLLLQLVRLDCGVGRILLVLAVLHLGLRLDLGQDPGVQHVVVVVTAGGGGEGGGRRQRAGREGRLMTGTAQGSDGSYTEFVIQLIILVREQQVCTYSRYSQVLSEQVL